MFNVTVTSGGVHGRNGTTLYDRGRDVAALANKQFPYDSNNVAEMDAALRDLDNSLACSMNKRLLIESGDRIEYDVAAWIDKCLCTSIPLVVDQDTVGLSFDWCYWPDILCNGNGRESIVVP